MKRRHRLVRGSEFTRLRREGKTVAGRYLVLSYVRNDSSTPEFQAGIITGKRIGNAVTRNRVRRRIRAVIDTATERIRPGSLFVIIARYTAPEADLRTLGREWTRLARRAKLFQEPKS